MEHLAIMKKVWKLTDKILSGDKKIESRWYSVKCKPWNRIGKGEIIYFKDSGESVRAKAEVNKVLQFADLTPKKVHDILSKYGKDIGIENKRSSDFFQIFKNKKYCIIIFLKNPTKIEPFEIDKTGLGTMSSWITISDINKIKRG